jgi:hypothetical protein
MDSRSFATSRSVGSGFGTKRRPPPASSTEHALHGERVEVDVEVQRRPEALDRGHGPAAPAPDAAARGSTALEAEESANEDPEDSSAELVGLRCRRVGAFSDRRSGSNGTWSIGSGTSRPTERTLEEGVRSY